MSDLKAIQKHIKKDEVYFITDEYNIRYLSNFTGTNGQILLTSHQAYFFTDFRYLQVAKKILPKEIELINTNKPLSELLNKIFIQHRITAVYFEEKKLSYLFYKNYKKNLQVKKFLPSLNFIENFRVIKTAEELKLIIKAQRLAEKAFLEVRRNLKIGKTEEQIAWEIEKIGHDFGADTISFPAIVGFGENSGSPHHQNSKRKLKKGDMVLIDMGMKYKGYCSDMTRMIFTTKPTTLQEKIYNTVLEAQETAIKKLKAGTIGEMGDKWARDVITQAGYGKTFGHSLGHGIGLEVHEAPYLSTNFRKEIPENTVVTVEPGIYLENSFGVRIEDMVLVKGKNVINLTKIPKQIKDSIFPIA